AIASYSEALRLLPEECRAERAHALGMKALALHFLQRWDEARQCAEEAIALTDAQSTTTEAALGRITLGMALAFLGDPEEGERHLREATRAAEELEWAEGCIRAHAHLAEVRRIQARFDDALALMLEGVEIAERTGM